MTGLLQENMAGAARAPTGEVHIKGQHGEFTYYVDGMPIPLGVFGGLNDVIDPKVIDRATFITGAQPAEYGGQIAAVIDVQTKVPSGKAHLDLSEYTGSYLGINNTSPDSLGINSQKLKPINTNGQALSFSDHIGKLGFFFSGSRQETDRRIDEPLPYIYHDHGFDYFLYGKIDYLAGDNDYLTMNLNFGKTITQVPYDPVESGALDDNQSTTNAFQTLSYFHTISRETDKESNLFIGASVREGGLTFTPGDNDPHTFIFGTDTTNPYILNEDRSFTTIGTRIKYDVRLSHELMFAGGLNFSETNGTENFTSKDTLNKPGPSPSTNYKGSDFGLFAQTEYHPAEWTRFDVGVRYDQHITPDAPLQSQISPRFKWNIFFDDATTAYLYYGKLFLPNNIEGLQTIASNTPGNTAVPTLPERDDFYEIALIHNFDFGLRGKIDGFRKVDLPGVDDQTVGSSAVKTPVNIQKVQINGIELSLSYSNPSTPFSGYTNLALTHAYGSGAVTGGFLAYGNDGTNTDLDHDQRLSVVIGLKYQPQNWFITLTPIYGSGLTNGNTNYVQTTGLFDFNQGTHTTPSWILDLSGGYTFNLSGGSSFTPSLFINNLLDNNHLIKGAYFSAASWEDRRNVVLKLAVHI
jgi:outer membrane receptor protein involved in Fe transport